MTGCENDDLINLARILGLTKFDCATALAYDISSLLIWLVAVCLLFYLVYENTRAVQKKNSICSNLKFSEIVLIFIITSGAGFGGFITAAFASLLFLVYCILIMTLMVINIAKSNKSNKNHDIDTEMI